MLKKYSFIFFCFIHIYNSYGFAQYQDDSNLMTIRFENNSNIYKWGYKFNYQKDFCIKGNIQVNEDFKSSLLRISNNKKKWKDDQRININLKWAFSPKFIGKVISSSVAFSDRISGIKNDINTNFGYIGIQSQPITNFNIESLVGYKFDSRFNQHDQGITYLFNMAMPSLNLNDYINYLRLNLNGDDFSVRKNKDYGINYFVSKQFYIDTSDSLFVTWSSQRRDNYDRWKVDKIYVESLNDEIFSIRNILNYRINKYIKFKVLSAFSVEKSEVCRMNTSNKRSKIDFSSSNNIGLNIKVSKIENEFNIFFKTEDQKNEVPDSVRSLPFSSRFTYISSNFNSSQLSVLNNLKYYYSHNDTLCTKIYFNIFRYDTPEETNFDDRDEFMANINFTLIHVLSSFLKLKLNAGVNLKHIVFIFGQRSADNNWMRIFRIYPELFYRLNKTIKIYQAFEVLANYVDYDFKELSLSSGLRSYVYRKFMLHHILTYCFSSKTSINLNYKLELEENGKLIWDNWEEMIVSMRDNHYCKLSFNYNIFLNGTISAGALLYSRSEELKYSDDLSNNYISYGPLLKFRYTPHAKFSILFSGSRRVITRVNKNRYYINNINMNLSWYL